MSNTLRFAVAALMCAFAVWWYLRRAREEERAAAATAALTAADVAVDAAVPAPPPPMPPSTPPAGFRRIDPTARAALLARLAARRAGQAAPAAAAPAPLPGKVDPAMVVESIMPLVPAFGDCYDATRSGRAVPQVEVSFDLMLEGDAEVGTLITDIKLTGDAGFDADPELGTCLRETMLAVELPPMSTGTSAYVRTSMQLRDDDDDAALDAGR